MKQIILSSFSALSLSIVFSQSAAVAEVAPDNQSNLTLVTLVTLAYPQWFGQFLGNSGQQIDKKAIDPLGC
ncbi:hypothetical protein ACKFKG_13945 [Phormidesmis sp. 146-35]